MKNFMKELYISIRSRYRNNSAVNIIWLLNFVPSLVGFPITSYDPVWKPFWVLHFTLLFYLYFWSGFINNLKHIKGVIDIIRSYVSIIVIMLVTSASHWYLANRKLIKTVLDDVINIDELSRKSEYMSEKYNRLLRIVKKIIYVYYAMNITDWAILYLPNRLNLSSGLYVLEPCAGIQLTTPLNQYFCIFISAIHDLTIIIVLIDFQALILFLVAHTSAMYSLLAEEMIALGNYKERNENYSSVVEKLPSLIHRHGMLLKIIKTMKSFYSNPLGVNFGMNAVFACLFFYLPFSRWTPYVATLIYCCVVFFLYCYLCQKLVNASEVFERAVYECGWETFRLKEMKTIYIVLKVAQRPAEILAADMVPVNMFTFGKTLQFIFKFVTVVKTSFGYS